MIPHKRLTRLDFSFDHSVFPPLMVNSKGRSLRILILFSDMKSTSEFSALKSKTIFGSFPSILENLLFWFTSMLYGDLILNLNDLDSTRKIPSSGSRILATLSLAL